MRGDGSPSGGTWGPKAGARPHAIQEKMRQPHFDPEEVLTADDFRPSLGMAHATVSGWSHNIPGIRDFMK